eukprot:scaffold27087_cov74-Phaeocystis_antarctica.AAC.5
MAPISTEAQPSLVSACSGPCCCSPTQRPNRALTVCTPAGYPTLLHTLVRAVQHALDRRLTATLVFANVGVLKRPGWTRNLPWTSAGLGGQPGLWRPSSRASPRTSELSASHRVSCEWGAGPTASPV